MEEQTFTITSDYGLHARAASILVHQAAKFESEIKLTYEGKNANLKSALGVMALAIPNGAEITITASGKDKNEAMSKMAETFKKQELTE